MLLGYPRFSSILSAKIATVALERDQLCLRYRRMLEALEAARTSLKKHELNAHNYNSADEWQRSSAYMIDNERCRAQAVRELEIEAREKRVSLADVRDELDRKEWLDRHDRLAERLKRVSRKGC